MPSGSDRQGAPYRWGSHVEKLLLPVFVVACAGLCFYGVEGLKQLRLVLQGDKLAKDICAPLLEIHGHCAEGLEDHASVAAAAIESSGAGPTLRKLSNSSQQLFATANSSCAVAGGLAVQCASVKELASPKATQDFTALGLEKVLGKQAEEAGRAGNLKTGELQAAAAKYRLDAEAAFKQGQGTLCSGSSLNLTDVCGFLQERAVAADGQFEDVLRRIGATSSTAIASMQAELAQVFHGITGQACPALLAVPESCLSLSQKVTDALKDAVDKAADGMPDIVPEAVWRGALDAGVGVARDHVDTVCAQARAVVGVCNTTFAQDSLSALDQLAARASQSLQAFLAPLRSVKADLLVTLQKGCTSAVSRASAVCTELSGVEARLQDQLRDVEAAAERSSTGSVEAAATQMRAAAATAQTTGEKALKSGEQAVGQLTSQLSEVCEGALSPILSVTGGTSPCEALGDAWAPLDASLAQAESAVRGFGGLSGQIQQGCGEISKLHGTCVHVMNPAAFMTKGALALWANRLPELLKLQAWLLAAGLGLSFVLLQVIRCHTEVIVILSAVASLAGLTFLVLASFATMQFLMGFTFLFILLLKGCWLFCIWDRLLAAAKLIHCGVEAVDNMLGHGAWVMGLLAAILQAASLALGVGAFYYLTGPTAPPYIPAAQAPLLVILATAWAVEFFANILHVTLSSAIGGHCGVETPGGPHLFRSFVFAAFGAAGSVALGSLVVAILKVVQYILHQMERNSNVVCRALLVCMCCVLEMLLKLYNAYAFVFVGLDGVGYFAAAPKLYDVFERGGIMALTTDQALHDVVGVVRMVAMYTLMLLGLVLGYFLGVFGVDVPEGTSWSQTVMEPLVCLLMGFLTAFNLTLTLGRLIEAAVCTIFVVLMEHRAAFEEAQPQLCAQLEQLLPLGPEGEEKSSSSSSALVG